MNERASTAPVVEALSVCRDFGSLKVVDGFDLVLAPGEIHGLIGPNGTGKTTILRLLAGLHGPTAGTVRVTGADPTSPRVRARIGWVPASDRSFYNRVSATENLLFFGRLYGLRRRVAAERAETLIEQVGLAGAAHRPTGEYSQGMLKRLALARALLADPALLLCDELTHDLDPDGTVSMIDLVKQRAAEGTAVVWATQRLDELLGLAGGVTVTRVGGFGFSGPMGELIAGVETRRFLIRVSPQPTPDALAEIAAAQPSTDLTGPDESGRLSLSLHGGATLGRVVARLEEGGFDVVSCTEAESEMRIAYRNAVGDPS